MKPEEILRIFYTTERLETIQETEERRKKEEE
jgi:hypothetical protein